MCFVKGRVSKVDVSCVHLLFAQPQALAKALEVDDLPLPQEADDVVYVGIIAETQDVIVCDAGFLFRGKVLGEVGDHVAGGLHASRAPWEAGSGGGVDAGGVVYKVGGEGGVIAHLLVAQVPGELMDQGGYHLHVAQLLCADVGEQAFGFRIGHGVALGEIPQGGGRQEGVHAGAVGGGCGAGPDGRQPPPGPYDPGGGRDHGPGSGEGQIKQRSRPNTGGSPDIKFDMILYR